MSAAEEFRKIRVGIDAAADRGDDLSALDDPAALNTAHEVRIRAVLLVQPGDHALSNGLDDHDRAEKNALPVHAVDHPVDKAAQKAAFTELQNLFPQSRPGSSGGQSWIAPKIFGVQAGQGCRWCGHDEALHSSGKAMRPW